MVASLSLSVPPLAFLLILWGLLEPKFSPRFTRWAALGFLAAECGIQFALFLSWEHSLEFIPTFTATFLPILCLHLLSKNHFFSTALTWMLALLCSQLLATLGKLVLNFTTGPDAELICALSLLAAAGLLMLLVYRFLREPFRAYARRLAAPPFPPGDAADPLLLFFIQHRLYRRHRSFTAVLHRPVRPSGAVQAARLSGGGATVQRVPAADGGHAPGL